jgi:hypothetical protein
MIIIKNSILPPKGYSAMAFACFILTRKERLSEKTIRHENIHYAQQKELLFVFQWLWYAVEWLIRLIQYGNSNKQAYYNMSFEREAYANEMNENYLKERKYWSFLKYLKNGK